jgi:uncharacterized protein YndB with AHSA1/START domain
MAKRSVTHATFVIERRYEAPPARVFAAWATPAVKARWYACHDDWKPTLFELDFRVGGREQLKTGPKGGTLHAFDGSYQDIVPDERIVYTYAMRLDETLISVSLATVELRRAGAGTWLTFTEQGAFLDGYNDVAGREEGTRIGLNNLAALLAGEHLKE